VSRDLVLWFRHAIDAQELASLRAAGRVHGLAYVPPPATEAAVREQLGANGIDLRAGFRVLEVGRQPAGWPTSLGVLCGGLVLGAIGLRGPGRRPDTLAELVEATRFEETDTDFETDAAVEAKRDAAAPVSC